MIVLDGLSVLFIVTGLFFFLAGTVGLLRFPDVFTRLHALTKADNVGLGFVSLGLAIQASSALMAAKLVLIWALVLCASTTACQMIARTALREGIKPWTRP